MKKIILVDGQYRELVKKFPWRESKDAVKYLIENNDKGLRTLGEDGEFI